jgi:diguanylate cyclase (GGDEF)-like protein
MGIGRHRALVPYISVCAFGIILVALTVSPNWGGAVFSRAVDDVSQLIAALVATALGAWRGLRASGRSRLSWFLMAAGTGSWAAGQMIWSYYELVSDNVTPFPSIADIGFLLFPVFALAGLLVRPSAVLAGNGRLRLVLDGVMVAASLFNLSWVSVLGEVWRSPSESRLGLLAGLAYPASDLILITVAVLVVVQARARTGLLLISGALIGMAFADSSFSYLTANGAYYTGSFVDYAWMAAFLMLGAAAIGDQTRGVVLTRVTVSAWYLVLPYFLVALGVAAVVPTVGHGATLLLAVGATAVLALILRQFLSLLDNRVLSANVADQRKELRYQAFHDGLTGLANRALFADRVSHALELHRRDMRPLALLFCDLDDFKVINDNLGHSAGDQVLVAVAERLRATVRGGDTVARLGGDEFAILLEDGGDALDLAGRILEAMSAAFPVGVRRLPVRMSIGVASLGPADFGMELEELLTQADLAMYAAKRTGKATAVTFERALRESQQDDLDLRIDLTAAIDGKQSLGQPVLTPAYQPIVRPNGSVWAYEALARWNRDGTPIPPDVFIPIAERSGLLPALDMLIIESALKLTSLDRHTAPRMSVNIGLAHLADTGLSRKIAELLDRVGLEPGRLIVEVPENHAIESPEVHRSLNALRRQGILVAIDDFGVGYSSLSRIGALNPDIIKLDRSFVAELDEAGKHTDFVAGVVDLSHRIGALVIAEGVETPTQLAVLTEMKCDLLQGYLLGRPAPQLIAPSAALLRTVSR